jgi:lipopolysaccharide export LptBFGC system permease protein LptF
MRISDRYLGKQVLFGTIYAVLVLSLVLVLGSLFKEIRGLLVEQKAPPLLLVRFIISVLPFSLMFTIPWGFLTAVLLVFGRLSTDHEVTAFRVAGMSLVRLAMPVFLIGAALSGVCLYLNVNVVPLAKASVQDLLMEEVKKDPRALLDPGKVQGFLKASKSGSNMLFVEGKKGDDLAGFHLYWNRKLEKGEDGEEERSERTYIHAEGASIKVDNEKRQFSLRLLNAFFEAKQQDGPPNIGLSGAAEPLVLPYDWKAPRTKANSMTNAEIRQYIQDNPQLDDDKKVDFRSEITKRFSFSMACFAFAFVAVPLGLNSRRKDTSTGLVLSLLLGAGYFMFTVFSAEFKTDLGSSIALWLPNVLCILAGLFLFRRAKFK